MFKGQHHESRKFLSLSLTLEHAYCKKSQLLRGTFCFTQVQGPNALTTLLHLADGKCWKALGSGVVKPHTFISVMQIWQEKYVFFWRYVTHLTCLLLSTTSLRLQKIVHFFFLYCERTRYNIYERVDFLLSMLITETFHLLFSYTVYDYKISSPFEKGTLLSKRDRLFVEVYSIINGWQLAKMKKSIHDISLP